MRILLLISCFSLISCMQFGTPRQALKPETPFIHYGASGKSPADNGWIMQSRDNYGVIFGKGSGAFNVETAVIFTRLFKTQEFSDVNKHLEFIEETRKINSQPERFKQLVMQHDKVKFKNQDCLKYKTISEDHGKNGIDSSDFTYLKTQGYACRHPSNNALVLIMELSHRSKANEFPNKLLNIGKKFFSALTINSIRFKKK